MKRKFTIPVVCALAFHAASLLGFRRGQVANPPSDDPLLIQIVPIPIDGVFGQPDEPGGVAERSEDVRGPEDANLPALPELPDPVKADSFVMATQPQTEVSVVKVDKIPRSILGSPDGKLDGLRGGGPVFDVPMLARIPQARAQPSPVFPHEAKVRGQSGEVVVGFTVGEEGRVIAAHVVHSSDPVFDEAALRAGKKWRFEPGRNHGRLVRFQLAVPIIFNLKDT